MEEWVNIHMTEKTTKQNMKTKTQNKNIIVINYDAQILCEETSKKISTLFNQLYTVAIEELNKKIKNENLNITVNMEIVEGSNTVKYSKKTIDKVNSCLIIHKRISKQDYDNFLEKQVANDVMEIIKIVNELRWVLYPSEYQNIENNILKLANLRNGDIVIDADILEICKLIEEARIFLKNMNAAPYYLKKYFKKDLFTKYKENTLFIYLYERLLRNSLPVYKTRKLILKSFNLNKVKDFDEENDLYPMYMHLTSFSISRKPKINAWFYIRKGMLLFPIYITFTTGTIIFPVLAIVSSLGILLMDYLINLDPEKYFISAWVVKTILYTILGLAVLLPGESMYQYL
jgi:hypothetical protein